MPPMILCVQRDSAIRAQYSATLESEGFQVLPASDGGQALEILKRNEPDFVVLDIDLPRQDGFEILAELKRLRGEAPIPPVLMACEGDVTLDLSGRARSLGALEVIPAPIDSQALVARVTAAIKPNSTLGASPAMTQEAGTLKRLPLPELIQSLYERSLDGVLLLEYGKKKKAVEFRAGWPVCVKSNLVSECLGNYLVETGRVSQIQMDESVSRMREGEGLQGQIFVAMDVLGESDVVAVLEEHARSKLFEVFAWPDGEYQIRTGVHIQRGSTIGLEGHPSNLIVAGVREKTPLKRVDRFLASHVDEFLVFDEASRGALNAIDLLEPEADWLEKIERSVAVSELREAPESIRRFAFGLICIDFFQVVAEGTEAKPSKSQASSSLSQLRPMAPATDADDDSLREELATMANAMRGADHFEVLGLTAEADDSEVEEAYAQVARRAHPDRFHKASSSIRQLSSQVFERLSEAREGLRDEDSRSRYALELERGRTAPTVEDEGRRALQAETEFQKGEKMLEARDYENALVCFGRAMENFPSEGEYRAHYGWCLYLCHPENAVMLGEALEHCREGLKLAKDREKPYLLLGRLYNAMGKPGAAKRMFTRAVQIKPQCVEAMREMRLMEMRRGKDKGVFKKIFRR